MRKILVSQLSGEDLDFAVNQGDRGHGAREARDRGDDRPFRPGFFWDHGGPIFECFATSLHRDPTDVTLWFVTVERLGKVVEMSGSTKLIAAMRAFVACEFGESVTLPT